MRDTLELIARSQQGDQQAKEELVEANTGLIWSVAKRFMGRGTETEDLYQLGCLGFLKAVEGFDLAYGTQFSTYAVPKIAGEIRRFLRDDGSVKVSRAMKQTAKEMNEFVSAYVAERGVQPSVREIAEKFGLEESEAVFVLGSSRMPLSLYGSTERKDGERELIETLPARDDQDELIDKLLLRSAIESLSERDRKIIVLRYFRDMTQSEVAEKIGVSQVQVSRIESRIIREFREKLTG